MLLVDLQWAYILIDIFKDKLNKLEVCVIDLTSNVGFCVAVYLQTSGSRNQWTLVILL